MKKRFFSNLFNYLVFRISALELVDFSQYFKETDLEVSLYLYDFNNKIYKTDKADFMRTTSPTSTFKILDSLIVLEIEAINDENDVLSSPK
jgi:beta-lactamase class D